MLSEHLHADLPDPTHQFAAVVTEIETLRSLVIARVSSLTQVTHRFVPAFSSLTPRLIGSR